MRIKSRLSKWHKPQPKIKSGYLARYSSMVSSASKGAVLKFSLRILTEL